MILKTSGTENSQTFKVHTQQKREQIVNYIKVKIVKENRKLANVIVMKGVIKNY